MTITTRVGLNRVQVVAIPVTDQTKAADFYENTLGLHKDGDREFAQLGGRWIEFSLPGSTAAVALIPARSARPAGVDTGIRFTTDDAAALHAELVERGVGVDELLQWPGIPPMFSFRDPDDNVLYVNGERPVS